MKIFITVIFCIIISLNLNIAYSSNKASLISEYRKITDTIMGGTLFFTCGGTSFKIESGLFSSPRLYWKTGVIWDELENAIFEDVGVIFTGLGFEDPISVKTLDLGNIQIPIFNKVVRSSDYIIGRRVKLNDYFIDEINNIFIPYKSTIDMLNSSMISINMEKIVSYFSFDSEKYKLEQGNINSGYFDLTGSKNTFNTIDRKRKIDEIIRNNSEKVQLTTPIGEDKKLAHCMIISEDT